MTEPSATTPAVKPPDVPDTEIPTSQSMKVWGWVVALSGTALMIWAFTMSVSVRTLGEYGLPSDVVNLGLLSTREMILTAGCALLVAGIVLVAAGHVRKGLELLTPK